jgi:signal transduction histidine kinase
MNLMTDRLADLLRANREFAANASHQLRTPLSALRLSLEEAQDGPDQIAGIHRALDETDRLTGIVDSLLVLGRVYENSAAARGLVDLRSVADQAVGELPTGGPVVEITGAGLTVADAERVRQVLNNVLHNARRFARSSIRVTVARRDDRVVVTVDDDGPGVPEAERARLFDRFTRGSIPQGQGSGLGLAVARELARIDGGSVSVGHGDLGGARFEVSFPSAT